MKDREFISINMLIVHLAPSPAKSINFRNIYLIKSNYTGT